MYYGRSMRILKIEYRLTTRPKHGYSCVFRSPSHLLICGCRIGLTHAQQTPGSRRKMFQWNRQLFGIVYQELEGKTKFVTDPGKWQNLFSVVTAL